MSYLCPLCASPLQQLSAVWRCQHGHQYDRAKEGYVNLLPVQFKRSKQPGDSAEMVHARRTFLGGGHYSALQHNVCALVSKWFPSSANSLLDIGCGEGYYTGAVAHQAQSLGAAKVFGLDVSKEAIRFAAKREKHVQFSVASSSRLPFADAAIDMATCIYAPYKLEELTRVIASEGYVVIVTPGPRHLIQFKSLIYTQVKEHSAELSPLTGFLLREQVVLSYPMLLSGSDAVALLQMTPLAWRASSEVWQLLENSEQFLCETDFIIRVWQKEKQPVTLENAPAHEE
ncbi:MAG: 23S rRNA (guanine(745)-N(1))-methyltransferase [Candidatus Erwinia impunctatus]|nr:23S rRNA (guanine(745)-N(1))-methyltransferase [Culicoides impunctatus]